MAPPNIHANLCGHAVQEQRHNRCVPVRATALFFFFYHATAPSGPHTVNCAVPPLSRLQQKPPKVSSSGRNIFTRNKDAFLWKIDDFSHHLILTH